MKQATLDLIKNIDENTFVPPSTKNELFELFQLDTVADLRKVSRNFMKLYEILEHLDGQTSSATTEKAGIVKFGTETGNAIDAETWKQAIGQSLGGYVSKVESKEAGKWYINDLTDGKIYKCIQNHTSKSFDITKFVDITNVGLSDKVENLPRFYTKTANVDFSNDKFTIKIPKSNFLFGILEVSQKLYGWSNKIIFTKGESCFEHVSSMLSQRLVITTDSQNVYLVSQDKNISLFLINSVTFFYYD